MKENLMNDRRNKKAIPNLIVLLVFMRRRVKGKQQQWEEKEEVERLGQKREKEEE